MSSFQYQARHTRDGTMHQSVIQADNVSAAIALLAEQSLEVLSIRLVDQQAMELSLAEPPAELEIRANYLRRIDEVLVDRVGLVELLQAISQEYPLFLGDHLEYLISKVKSGVTAEQFLADSKLIAWLPVLTSGQNPELLARHYSRWVAQVSSQQQRLSNWRWALSYPLFLIVCAVVLLVPIYVLIVPPFKKMFSDFGLRLPAPTMLLIRISDALIGYPITLGLGAVVLIALGVLLARYWHLQSFTTRYFGVLTAGNNFSLLAMSRLTSILAEMLDLGAPLRDSLIVAGRASRHAFYRQLCENLAREVVSHDSNWRRSVYRYSLPTTLLHALEANPAQTPSVPLLRELAEVYSQRTYHRRLRNAGLAAPILIGLVGITIAFVVVALFMPLVQMMTSLT